MLELRKETTTKKETYGGFVSYFALDATKSSVCEGHLCQVLFSKVSWLRSTIEYVNTRLATTTFLQNAAVYIFRKQNKSQICHRHKNAVWFVLFPETE